MRTVYPRAISGEPSAWWSAVVTWMPGLSPRVRGNRVIEIRRRSSPPAWVYPRAYGGTGGGSDLEPVRVFRSIPARTGEPSVVVVGMSNC